MAGNAGALEAAFRAYQVRFCEGYDPSNVTDDELEAVILCLDDYTRYLNRRISQFPHRPDHLVDLLTDVLHLHAKLLRGRARDEEAMIAELESETPVEIGFPQCKRREKVDVAADSADADADEAAS